MKPQHCIFFALASLLLAACSASEPSEAAADKPLASISSLAQDEMRAPANAELKPSPSASDNTPRSEEALVDRVARTLGSRDLKSLQALATPEFSADLERMYDRDPAGFWIRASVFVQNVKSGFEVIHRQEDTREQWNIVLRFGNGQEERLTFTREGGVLRIVDL